MSRENTLRMGRRAREKTMTSSCRITRPGATRTFDPSTGEYESTTTVVYEGKCHFKAYGVGQRIGNTAEGEMTATMYDVALPFDGAPHVSVSDTLVLTSTDLAWPVGTQFPVTGVDQSDDRTAFHVTVTEQDRTVSYA